MSFHFASAAFATVLLAAQPAAAATLKVCADPNNLPFSNAAGEGFENKIVELLGRELGMEVRYTWWPQRRGFIRSTLDRGLCDLVPGVPSNLERVKTTRPYYRSSYVFVSRRDDRLELSSLNDPRLRSLKIGVTIIGDDGSNTPPAHALSRRGIVNNVRGYLIYGDYGSPSPTAPVVEAVANGAIDIAVVWGPTAGYFASRQATVLDLSPVEPRIDGPMLPMVFDISMAVRKKDLQLRNAVDAVLARRRDDIDRILADYDIPRLDLPLHPEMGVQ